jgi:hypothetical protein
MEMSIAMTPVYSSFVSRHARDLAEPITAITTMPVCVLCTVIRVMTYVVVRHKIYKILSLDGIFQPHDIRIASPDQPGNNEKQQLHRSPGYTWSVRSRFYPMIE